MSGALGVKGLPPPPSSLGGSMPRYSATMAISSARRRRWPFRRSVTAEGERPSALARPLRVLPVCLSPARIQSTVNLLHPLFERAFDAFGARPAGFGRLIRWGLILFPKNRNHEKRKIDRQFGFAE